MKVSVFVPDSVFAEAEALAARLNVSRDELYSCALREFIDEQNSDPVTEGAHAAAQPKGHTPDLFRAEAARRVLRSVEW